MPLLADINALLDRSSGWKLLRHILVLAAYLILAALYTYPLIQHLRTHLLGTGVGAVFWNVWHFHHALTQLHSNPFWTDYQYWPYGTNLILTNYSLSLDLAALLLIPHFGLVGSYNLLLLGGMTLSGYGVYLMARDWDISPVPAFIAGCIFVFSPYHLLSFIGPYECDFSQLEIIPFFIWALCRAIRQGRMRYAFLAALAWSLIWATNYYHFMFMSLLLPAFYCFWREPIRFRVERRAFGAGQERLSRVLKGALLLALIWAVRAVLLGQKRFHGTGSFWELAAYTAPYLSVWGALGAWLLLRYRLKCAWNKSAWTWPALAPFVMTAVFWVLLNLPLIVSCVRFILSGSYGAPRHSWRGGGDPLDLLSLFLPSSFHPLYGPLVAKYLGFALAPEVCLGFGVWFAIAWLWRHRTPDRWLSLWFFGFAFSLIMVLGPWLKVAGVHTYLPLPFYFVHLFPIFSNLQGGAQFIAEARFFAALLCAAFLQRIWTGAATRRRVLITSLFTGLVAFEYSHGPLPIYPWRPRPLLERLSRMPRGGLLEVPFGAIFNAQDSRGTMGSTWLTSPAQVTHQQPVVGGQVMRVPRYIYENTSRDPVLQGLLAVQAGADWPRLMTDRAFMRRYFRGMHIRYILLNSELAPAALQRGLARWPVRLIDQDPQLQLYETEDTPHE